MAPMLELNDFHYYYGNIHSVKGISLHVDEGEMVTLIGANGAGKTTTLQTVSGLTSHKGIRGEIKFQGERIDGYKGHKIAARGLAHVLEGRRIFSKLTVLENLMIGAYTRKDTKGIEEDLKAMFKLFPRLEERKSQHGGTLSGGEQQMLAIARAIISKPKMLLLDEPSLGLAPIIVKEIFVAIKQINQNGLTVMFVEQNSKIALSTADRGYVMQTGEMVMHDTCQNLLANEDVKKAYLGG